MTGSPISVASERTGFAPSALRFYEQAGLLRPDRTTAGYRSYSEADIEVLTFIKRAKRFGLSLDAITDLLALLEDGQCAPVQGRLRELVESQIVDAQTRIGELVAFTAELQRVAATLGVHTPDGPCDDACGCTSEQVVTGPTAVQLTAAPSAAIDPPIACTLSGDRVPERVAEWQMLLASATQREPMASGVRVRFSDDTDVASLAALAAAEQGCCRFFTFHLTIGPTGVTFDVTGPPDARPVIDAMFGAAA